jgi:hypothetical protein
VGRLSKTLEAIEVIGKNLDDAYAASRGAGYNTPTYHPQRSFEEDYPDGAKADNYERITHDMDGRPIGEGVIVGRNTVGGVDIRLPTGTANVVGESITGNPVVERSASRMGRNLGRTSYNKYSKYPTQVEIRKGLTPYQYPNVTEHELGHVISQASGEIPFDDEVAGELRYVYNQLNNADLDTLRDRVGKEDVGILRGRLTGHTPETNKNYTAQEAPQEYIAEGIRAYIQNPNFIKTVAPKFAAMVREAVNSNEKLNKIIQFNQVTGALPYVGGAALAAGATQDAEAGVTGAGMAAYGSDSQGYQMSAYDGKDLLSSNWFYPEIVNT